MFINRSKNKSGTVEKKGTDVKTSVISATPRKDNSIHIPFSDGHGLTAKDIHGNQDAQIHGSFKWEKNDRGEFDAVTLNALHDSYPSVPIDKLTGLEEYTMLLQFTIPDSEEGPVFYFGDISTFKYMDLLYRHDTPDVLRLGSGTYYADLVTLEKYAEYYDIPCPARHENMQFALIRNGEELKIFINGEPGLHLNPYAFPRVSGKNMLFNLGKTPSVGDYITSTGASNYSSFKFEDLRIYNRALSEN